VLVTIFALLVVLVVRCMLLFPHLRSEPTTPEMATPEPPQTPAL
jgi:hypothetical protein